MTLERPNSESGVANIGAAFLLLAVVIGAAVFAFAVTHLGVSVGDRLALVGSDALEQTERTITAPGPIYVKDVNGDQLIDERDTITFDVTAGPGGQTVALDAIDASLRISDATSTPVSTSATTIVGNGDSVLETGETVELRLVPDGEIASGEQFVIQLTPADGAPVSITATMPLISDSLMTLYY